MNYHKPTPVIILSAELKTLNGHENRKRTGILKKCLNSLKIPYGAATGCYKGTKENSFICFARNQAEIDALTDLALNQFNQECVMYVDDARDAYLIDMHHVKRPIGELKAVTPTRAHELKSWTYSAKLDTYFAVESKQ